MKSAKLVSKNSVILWREEVDVPYVSPRDHCRRRPTFIPAISKVRSLSWPRLLHRAQWQAASDYSQKEGCSCHLM